MTPPVTTETDRLARQVAEDFQHSIRLFILARVRDPATADDLTQEVLVRVTRKLATVREPGKLAGWVFQVARHVVIDHFRQVRETEEFDEQRHATQASRPAIFDEEEQKLRADLARYIRCVVEHLPPRHREALQLTEYDGLSQVELARRLGISVSAAKSRVQRARSELKSVIERCCHWETDRYGRVVEVTPRRVAGRSCKPCR